MSTESVIIFNHLILGCSLLHLPSIFSNIRVFSNESAVCIRWPKYWSFSISPSSEYSGLISFRIDWFDLLAVQVTLRSLLQHHNLKASILQCFAFIYTSNISIKYTHSTNISNQSIYSFNLSIYPSMHPIHPCIPTIHPSIHPLISLIHFYLSIVHLSIMYLFITYLYSDFLWNYELHPEKAPTCFVYSCRLIVTTVPGSGQALDKYMQCGPVNEWPCTARRSNQSILKETSPGCSLEELVL